MMEYVQMTLDDWMEIKEKIRKDLQNVKHAFVRIGYNLRRIRDEEAYKTEGYGSLSEFAEKEYGLNASTVSRLISINEKYSVDGYSEQLLPEYENFRQGSLTEMLALPDGDLQMITPQTAREDIRDLKRFNAAPAAGASKLGEAIEEFCRQNRELINELYSREQPRWTDEKDLIGMINPSGSRTFKKGLFFLSFTESDIRIKEFGGAPQTITYREFLGMIADKIGDEKQEHAWEKYFGEPVEEALAPAQIDKEPGQQADEKPEPEPIIRTKEKAAETERSEPEVEEREDGGDTAGEPGESGEESGADRENGKDAGERDSEIKSAVEGLAADGSGSGEEPAGDRKPEKEAGRDEATQEPEPAADEPKEAVAPAQIMPEPVIEPYKETEDETAVRELLDMLSMVEQEIRSGHWLSAEMRVNQLKARLQAMRR